ncbi:MAG: hypothetical protein NTY53_03610, partial [Kiritimatiellaeota bacterium]|nr:hypothetical protein [Kiritimatiellota bacterium]
WAVPASRLWLYPAQMVAGDRALPGRKMVCIAFAAGMRFLSNPLELFSFRSRQYSFQWLENLRRGEVKNG